MFVFFVLISGNKVKGGFGKDLGIEIILDLKFMILDLMIFTHELALY